MIFVNGKEYPKLTANYEEIIKNGVLFL